MDHNGLLFEMLLTGFFAVACMRARVTPNAGEHARLSDIFRFRGRIDRIRRSRLQWISIVILLILARIQWSIPMFVEVTFALMLALFIAVPGEKSVAGEVCRG